jgi:hypothetical protein
MENTQNNNRNNKPTTKQLYSIEVILRRKATRSSLLARLTQNEFDCRIDTTASVGNIAFFSFSCLDELIKAHELVQGWKEYKVKILKYSIPKTYSVDKDTIAGYPIAKPNNEVLYVHSQKDVATACEILEAEAMQDGGVLGLDCEWKPEFDGKRNPIAVIQMASSHTSVVFHLSLLRHERKELPAPLTALLANDQILKVVVGPQDASRIYHELHHIEINHVDLQRLPIVHRFSGNGLATMAAILFQQRVQKNVKLTNWTRPLTPSQIQYAALDAELTLQIFFEIMDLPLD